MMGHEGQMAKSVNSATFHREKAGVSIAIMITEDIDGMADAPLDWDAVYKLAGAFINEVIDDAEDAETP